MVSLGGGLKVEVAAEEEGVLFLLWLVVVVVVFLGLTGVKSVD